jgi:hypothetical protein
VFWQDVVFDRWIDKRPLVNAFASALAVQASIVLVIDGFDGGMQQNEASVLIDRVRKKGQYPLQASIYLRDDALWQKVHRLEDSLRATKRLCASLDTSCIVAGTEAGQESDFLIRPSGQVLRIVLDEQALDEEFVILRCEPAIGLAEAV